ncbi:MAG: Sinorhizobium phage [Pseudomonadota bacterium]|jgi:hypothetical protein
MTGIYPIDPKLARKAAALAVRGLKGKAMGQVLKVSTDEANTLAAMGRALIRIDDAKLTALEKQLLVVLAGAEMGSIDRGSSCSISTKYISRLMRKGDGWATATIRRRLCTHRPGEDERRRGTGFGFAWYSGNGYCGLTASGWAFVHAIGETAASTTRAAQ